MKHYMLKLSLFAIVVLMCAACQKNDANDSTLETKQQQAVERFLSLPGGAEPDLRLVVNELEAKNKRFSFITKFIAAYGYIKWEHVVKFEYNDGSRSYFLPLGNDTSKEVGAVIECVVKDGRTYATAYHRSDLDAAVKRTQGTTDKIAFIGLFREFEHTVYAKPRYWITFFDTKGNELYAYPADESKVPPQTKAGGCYWVGVGVEDIEGGGSSGGATDIRWELRCPPPDALPVFDDSRPEDDENPWDLPGDGGGAPPPDENQDDTDNPCNKASTLGQNAKHVERLKDLAASTSSLYEVGVVINANGQHQTTVGQLGANNVQVVVPWQKIDFFAHTHFEAYPGNLYTSIFSATDIGVLYNLHNKGYVNNVADFQFALVTPSSTYILMISDEAAFAAFGGSFSKGSVLWKEYVKDVTFDDSANESNLLDFIQENNCGLTLYKADSYTNKNGTFDIWSARKNNSNGVAIKDDCK